MLNYYKDICRVVALALIIRAVYTDSIACAICSGMLYMGGFDDRIHFLNLFSKKRIDDSAIKPSQDLPNNVHPLRKTWADD